MNKFDFLLIIIEVGLLKLILNQLTYLFCLLSTFVNSLKYDTVLYSNCYSN